MEKKLKKSLERHWKRVKTHPLKALIASPVNIFTTLCTILLLFDIKLPLKRLALVLALIVCCVTLIATLAHSVYCHRNKKKCQRQSDILRRERDRLGRTIATLMRSNTNYCYYQSWREIITIQGNGDTLVEREVELMPGTYINGYINAGSASMDIAFMSLTGNNKVDDPSKVTFKSYIKKDGGKISAHNITSWEYENSIVGIVVLDKEYRSNECVSLICEWNWPKYSFDLANGRPERHIIKLRRRCDKFECVINITKGAPATRQRAVVVDKIEEFSDDMKSLEVTYHENQICHTVTFSALHLGSRDCFGVALNWTEPR